MCPPTVVGSRASRGRSGPALVKRPPTWLVVHLQASPIVFKGWTDSWQPCHISSCLDLSLETMQRTMPTHCCSPSVYLRGHAASFSFVSPLVQPAQKTLPTVVQDTSSRQHWIWNVVVDGGRSSVSPQRKGPLPFSEMNWRKRVDRR